MNAENSLHSSIAQTLKNETTVSGGSIQEYLEDLRSSEKEKIQSKQKRDKLLESLRESVQHVQPTDQRKTVRDDFARIIRDGYAAEVESFVKQYEKELQNLRIKRSISIKAESIANAFQDRMKLFIEKKNFLEKIEKSITSLRYTPSKDSSSNSDSNVSNHLELTFAKLSSIASSTRNEITVLMEDILQYFEQMETQIENDSTEEETVRFFFGTCVSSLDDNQKRNLIRLSKTKTQNISYEQRISFYRKIVESLASMAPQVATKIHSVCRKKARLLIQQGQYKQAIAELCYALHLWREDADTYRSLANAFFRQKNEKNGYVALREVLRLTPDDIALRKRIADYYFKTGEFEKAIQEYDELLQRNPLDQTIRRDFGKILFDGKLYERIPEVLNPYIKKAPHDVDCLKWLGESFRQTGDWQRTLLCLERAFHLGLREIETIHSLTLAYRKLHFYEDAERFLNQCIQENSNSITYSILLATVYQEWGKLEQAESFFLQIIQNEDSSASLYLVLAQIQMELDKPQEALDHFEKAYKLDNSRQDILVEFGKFLRKRGNYSRAELLFQKSLCINKNDSNTWQELALIYSETGNWQKAAEALKQGIQNESLSSQ